MLIIDCDIKDFMAENIPLGDDKEDETFPQDVREDEMEEVMIDE